MGLEARHSTANSFANVQANMEACTYPPIPTTHCGAMVYLLLTCARTHCKHPAPYTFSSHALTILCRFSPGARLSSGSTAHHLCALSNKPPSVPFRHICPSRPPYHTPGPAPPLFRASLTYSLPSHSPTTPSSLARHHSLCPHPRTPSSASHPSRPAARPLPPVHLAMEAEMGTRIRTTRA